MFAVQMATTVKCRGSSGVRRITSASPLCLFVRAANPGLPEIDPRERISTPEQYIHSVKSCTAPDDDGVKRILTMTFGMFWTHVFQKLDGRNYNKIWLYVTSDSWTGYCHHH